MALDKMPISINLGVGMDQKDDQKAGNQLKLRAVKDFVHRKIGRIDKRPGQAKLPTTVVNAPAGTPSIGTSAIPSACFSHKNQLLLENKGILYSYLKDKSQWNYKGSWIPLTARSQTIVSNEKQVISCDTESINGLTISAYFAYDQLTGYSLRYSAFEESSGTYIVEDALISNTVPYPCTPRFIKFANSIFVSWAEQSTFNIKIAAISSSTAALGAITTLKNDFFHSNGATGYSLGSDLAPAWVVCNKAGVGERAFCAYFNSANIIIFAIDNTGAVDATIGVASLSSTGLRRGFGIHYNAGTQKLFVAYASDTIITTVLNFTSIGYANIVTYSCGLFTELPMKFTACDDPTNSSHVYLFWDETFVNVYSNPTVSPPTSTAISEGEVYYAVLTELLCLTSKTLVGRGLLLSSKAVSDNLRNTVYLHCYYNSALQSTNFLVDVLRGKTEAGFYIQAKWDYRNVAPMEETLVRSTIIDSQTKFRFGHGIKTRIVGTFGGEQFQQGVAISTVDFAPSKAPSKQFLAETTFVSGGYLGYYDGGTFSEHGFFISPELFDISAPTAGGAKITFANSNTGGVGVNAFFDYICLNAQGMAAAVGPSYYWAFTTNGNPPVIVWYKIQGIGSQPSVVGATIYVEVDLTGNETAEEVAVKTMKAIVTRFGGPGIGVNITRQGNATYRITNIATGGLAGPDNSHFSTIDNIDLTAGNYLFNNLWSWVDVNGQILRSDKGTDQVVTVAGNSVFGMVVQAPPITNRSVSSVRVEGYGTETNKTVLKKITNYSSEYSWSLSSRSIGMQLGAAAGSAEQIYTTGSVLGNFQPGSCKHISKFKNRLLVSGLDDNTIYYSKTAQNNAPVEFSEELLIRLDNDDDALTGHIEMDGKLLMFKNGKIVYSGGDGANDIGTNSSLTQPINIATDVGCSDHNSIQVTPDGVIFKSKKGIQLLSRSLQVVQVGKDVEDFDSNVVARAVVLTKRNELRFTLSDIDQALCYNFQTQRWSYFTDHGGQDSCIWNDQFTHVYSDGSVAVEDETIFKDNGFSQASYAPQVETKWLKVKNVQDLQRIWRVMVLGELKSAHSVAINVYYDFDETVSDSYTFNSSNISGTGQGDQTYQFDIHLKRQKCEAIKVKMSFTASGGTEETVTLTDLALLAGVKQGLNKLKAGKKL